MLLRTLSPRPFASTGEMVMMRSTSNFASQLLEKELNKQSNVKKIIYFLSEMILGVGETGWIA